MKALLAIINENFKRRFEAPWTNVNGILSALLRSENLARFAKTSTRRAEANFFASSLNLRPWNSRRRIKNIWILLIIFLGLLNAWLYQTKSSSQVNYWLLILVLFNLSLYFLISRKIFNHYLTSVLTTFILSILPWFLQISLSSSSILVLSLTNLFYFSLYFFKSKLNFTTIIPLVISASLLVSLFAVWQSKQPLILLHKEDINKINIYRDILNPINNIFSRLYANKGITILKNLESNFFEVADLNYYFFANHPLERPGIQEKERLYSSLLPLFIIGLFSINFIKQSPLILLSIMILLLNSILSHRYYDLNTGLITPFLIIIGNSLDTYKVSSLLRKFLIILFFVLLISEFLFFSLRFFVLL